MRKIILIFSVGLIIGFFIGIFESINLIFTNRYIHYGMFKLVALTFQRKINSASLISICLLLLGYFLWNLLIKKIEFDKNKLISLIFTLFVGVISYWLIKITPYYTFLLKPDDSLTTIFFCWERNP